MEITMPLKPPAPIGPIPAPESSPLLKSSSSPEEAAPERTNSDRRLQYLLRHDSTYSVASEYEYESANNLNVLQGAVLLTADCLGTGILALPGDIKVLGMGFGLTFLILNLPINLYAGTIFHYTATSIETQQETENELYEQSVYQQQQRSQYGSSPAVASGPITPGRRTINNYQSIDTTPGPGDALHTQQLTSTHSNTSNKALNQDTVKSIESAGSAISFVTSSDHEQFHHDTATFDFIGMARALWTNNQNQATVIKWVTIIYYTNIFLVLGNYILVMSHAVSAMFGGSMCYPTAGLIASIGMFIVSQSRTMAHLGKCASFMSLAALSIVVMQCLYASTNSHNNLDGATVSNEETEPEEGYSILRKLSALGSIGFAVGSQKLFLNIRHELADRSTAPRCLALSLSTFGAVYVAIVLIVGTANAPAFLFDSIQPGINRRVAGFFLWAHVVVSYAINSQAICSSMDRLIALQYSRNSSSSSNSSNSSSNSNSRFDRLFDWLEDSRNATYKWMILTGIMAVTAYTVANAVPFFKDLVALIGAVTSVPLTLLLPAIYWRRHLRVPIWWPTYDTISSYALTIFSAVFLVAASIGSFYSIELDWSSHGKPFSCH